MKFSLAVLFLLLGIHVSSQTSLYPAPACDDRSTLGTCKDGKLVDGRHYIYDASGKLVEIRLYLDGKYVGNGLLSDSVVVTKPKPIPRPPDPADTGMTPKIERIIDSIRSPAGCSVFRSIADTAQFPSSNGPAAFKGDGFQIIYTNGLVTRKGYFHNGQFRCGVEYIYKKRKLRSINVYQEGKLTGTVKVPKKK